jgi:hypothetical protein
LNIGDKVLAQWCGEENHGMWYNGTIKSINVIRKTAHVLFDDGDNDDDLPWIKIRMQ